MDRTPAQALALAALRVTLGLLLVWWGLAKITNAGMGVSVSNKFYLGLFSDKDLQFWFGWAQLAVGGCVALGLMKKFAVPAQLVITGGSSLAIWNALLDPFALWLPVEKVAPVQHLFYPSAIALAGAAAMIAFRKQDVYSLDHLLDLRKALPKTMPAE
ncbi:MAG: hypothetical protein AAF322_17480 [Pseudomonadota bacterium]